jgi:hypothetical protein
MSYLDLCLHSIQRRDYQSDGITQGKLTGFNIIVSLSKSAKLLVFDIHRISKV